MSKRRISQQQLNRIKQLQTKQQDPLVSGKAERGTVIAHHGKYADVQCKDDKFHCTLRQNLGGLVVGDDVFFQLNGPKQGVITGVKPRKSKFWRADEKGQEKLIAANIDQVFIVMAPVPEPSWLLLDSYLAAIEALHLPAMIIFNKMDLAKSQFEDKLAIYENLNIHNLKTSVVNGLGLDSLKQAMQSHRSVFVGQSGVGKSSLIQCLLPEEALQVGDLHETTGLGTHTTSTARMYSFPSGGELIDSPGIRDFNLWPMTPLELAKTFVDFKPFIGECKFRDCVHLHEPHCAIQAAMKKGKIALSRWQNYHRLLERFKP